MALNSDGTGRSLRKQALLRGRRGAMDTPVGFFPERELLAYRRSLRSPLERAARGRPFLSPSSADPEPAAAAGLSIGLWAALFVCLFA